MINFVFWWPFCFLSAILAWILTVLWPILCLGGHFVFWRPSWFWKKKFQKININYHTKSGAPSSKIDRVMINFVFGRPFCFLVAIFLVFLAEGLYEVNFKIWISLLEIWVRYDPFCFWWLFCFLTAILFSLPPFWYGFGKIWRS